MLKQAAYFSAFVILTLAIFVTGERFFSPSFQRCIQGYEHGSSNTAAKNDPTIFGVYVRCSGRFADEHGSGITALATIIIAGFTGTLWIATSRQAKLTRASIDLARQEFTSTHRPKIILREAWAIPTKGEPITVTLTFVNQGISKAWIVESAVATEFFEKSGGLFLVPDTTKRMDLASPNDFVGGQARTFIHRSPSLIWDENTMTKWIPLNLGVFIVGHLIYIDDANTRRHTAFRRRFNPYTQRFYPIDDDELEYAD